MEGSERVASEGKENGERGRVRGAKRRASRERGRGRVGEREGERQGQRRQRRRQRCGAPEGKEGAAQGGLDRHAPELLDDVGAELGVATGTMAHERRLHHAHAAERPAAVRSGWFEG